MARCASPFGWAVLCILSALSLSANGAIYQDSYVDANYDPDNAVSLTIPRTLLPDVPNRIQLRSAHPLSRLSVGSFVYGLHLPPMNLSYRLTSKRSADGLYVAEVDFRPPFVTDEGGAINLNVTYEYCPPEKEGQSYSEEYGSDDTDDVEEEEEDAERSDGDGDADGDDDDQEAGAGEGKDQRRYRPKACREPKKKSQLIYASFVRKFVVILGESDKPIYRPGENIRFRFIALNSRQLLPSTKKLKWPKFRVDRQDYMHPKLVEISEDERRRHERSPEFDVIYVEDPSGNRVKEWRNVQQTTALNLSFPLLRDASEGVWRIVAKVFTSTQTLEVDVKNYVLPRFLASIQIPEEVDISSETAQFNVCATYTNGNSFQGHYDAQICVCSGRKLRQQQDLGTPFENNVCLSGPDLRGAGGQCLRVAGRLSGTPENGGCVGVNATIKALMQRARGRYDWDQQVGFIVSVSEADTGSAVTQFGQANIRRFRAPKLSLEIDRAYRPGLPIHGKVRLTEMSTVTSSPSMKANLTVFEILNPCGPWFRGGNDLNPNIYFKELTLNADGVASFILPPVKSERDLEVKVDLIRDETMVTPTTTTPSPFLQRMIRPYWEPPMGDANFHTSRSLRRWKSLSSLALKVRSINGNSPVDCPGWLNLSIVVNAPLAGKTLFLEYLSRGVPTQRFAVLQPAVSGYVCSDEDSDLGHYTCNVGFRPGEVGEISCLPGWTGENCLTPHCSEGQCGRGGLCVAPGRCACKVGWTGERCETCVPRRGCVHGRCVQGGDCVCEAGYAGYLCDGAVVDYERLDRTDAPPTTTTEGPSSHVTPPSTKESDVRRTIFMHEASFEMDSSFGPSLSAVVYVNNVNASSQGGYELITDLLKIENLKLCSTPAMFESQAKSFARNNFKKHSVMPGEGVGLQLSVPIGRSSETSGVENSCIVRLVDTSLKNFEKFQETLIDLNKYTDELQNNRRPYYSDYSVDSTKAAFDAIGLEFLHTGPFKKSLEKRIICPMFSVNARGPVDDGIKDLAYPDSVDSISKPRLREFFPEVWLFDHIKLGQAGQYATQLTAPDSITRWEFTALCFTRNLGLWMPARLEPETLTVSLPFYVEFTPPVKAKRQEVLHLPVSVFMLPHTSTSGAADEKACYEVLVSVAVDRQDWQLVGSSEFVTCLCQGDAKVTFTLALKPQKLGRLNVTAEAVAKLGSAMCSEGSTAKQAMTSVADAVRRSVLIVPEGVEAETNVGGVLCLSEGKKSLEEVMQLNLPENIVEDSLRSYVSVSGNVLGKAVKNLDNLVRLPTGCGEQNMVKVAPSVYVLKYLVAATDLHESETKKLAETAIGYIGSGYSNQLNYRHDNGSFSTFGQSHGLGSTWLTAFVFGVFSEAEQLLQEKAVEKLRTTNVALHPTLSTAFEFLRSVQRRDGCFAEYGRVFHSDMHVTDSSPKASLLKDLLLTSYVLSALVDAPVTVRETKSQTYANTMELASRCLLDRIDSYNVSEIPLRALAKVAYALRRLPGLGELTEKRAIVLRELVNRATVKTSRSGALRWWNDENTAYPASEVETTGYAYLALAESQSISQLLPIIRWLSAQQNEQGGFYSTQDTVVALRALAHAAGQLHLSTVASASSGREASTVVTASVLPGNSKTKEIVVNRTNTHISQQVELGYHSRAGSKEVRWEVSSPAKATCVAVHLSLLYNTPDPTDGQESADAFFVLSVSTRQGQEFTPECTHANTTVCVSLSKRAVKSADSIATGMILVTFELPSGWTMKESDLAGLKYPGLSRVEYDAQKQTLFAYFDAFTETESENVGGRDRLSRCVSLPLSQKMFVEPLSPSLIRVQDYYAPQQKTEVSFLLNTCKRYWNPDFLQETNATVETPDVNVTPVLTTPALPSCPNCTTDDKTRESLVQAINESVCYYGGRIHLFKPQSVLVEDKESIRGTMHFVAYGKTVASWNTTLGLASQCSCDIVRGRTSMVAILSGLHSFDFYPGSIKVELRGHAIVPFNDLQAALADLTKRLKTKTSESVEAKCPRLEGLQMLVRKLADAK
nr:unnamed protein product [Spirometra erinaceieuropaei]